MKIAIVTPLLVSIPPKTYGGIENVVHELVHGLAQRGHLVTVFCSGDSTIAGPNIQRIEITNHPTGSAPHENRAAELKQFHTILHRQHAFDVIHFHYEPIVLKQEAIAGGSNFLDEFAHPVVCTFHNITTIPEHIAYYRSARSLDRHQMVFISENQRSHVPFFSNARVIYNGLPLDKFPCQKQKGGYLLFLGRITRSKGILEAITVAEKTGIPLVIAAKIDPVDQTFYEHEVKARIDGEHIRYVGEVSFHEKLIFLGNARALLFPILWEEPFGLVMIEALACGTPVVAFRRGSVPEIIQDGINGYVVDTVDEMADALKRIERILPQYCRRTVEELFSSERMVDAYEALYREMRETSATSKRVPYGISHFSGTVG